MFAKIALLSILAAVASSAVTRDIGDLGFKAVFRIYEECSRTEGGLSPCLKKKAILFFDRAARMENIPLTEGVNVVKSSDTKTVAASESDIEASLPRKLEEKDQALTDMLLDRIATFANSRTIQLSLPKVSSQELGRGMEEGRGKMKKMMGMMAMGFAMKMAAMVPMAIMFLFILAGKALIVAKIALLLSGIMVLKKLMMQKGGGGGHESHGWSSGGSSGGWDRRSYNDVSDIAYSAYKPQQTV